jgi:translocation and assembly module TamB
VTPIPALDNGKYRVKSGETRGVRATTTAEGLAMAARPESKKSRARLVLAILALFSAGLYGFLSQPFVRARLRSELVAVVRKDFGLDADLAGVSVAFPLTLRAEGVVLRHPQHGLLAKVDTLTVTPSLRRLLEGKLKLKRIVVEGPHVRLRIVDGKLVNLPSLPSSKSDERPGRDVLRELRLRGGRVEIDAAPAYRAELHGVDVAAFVRDDKRLGVRVAIAGGSFDHGEAHEQLASSFLSGRYSDERVEVDSARIASTLGHVIVRHGTLGLPVAQGAYDAQIEASVKLHKLAALPLGFALPKLDGEISTKLKVSGTGARYAATGTLHAENPELEDFGFGFVDLHVAMTPEDIQVLPGSVARIVMDGGELALEGRLGLGAGLPVEARVEVTRLELHKLMAQLNVTQNCLVNWLLKGGARVSGTIDPLDIKGPVWADHVSFRALTSAWHDPTAREVIGTPPGHVQGRVAVRPDALRFENLVGKLPHSEMQVTVHIGFDDKIGVTARSSALDLRDATGIMGMPIGGRGSFSMDVGGTYSKTTLTGSVDLEDFSFDGFRLGHLKTDAVLEKGGIAVRFMRGTIRKNDTRYTIDDMLLDFSEHFSLEASGKLERLHLADFYHTLLLDQDPDFAPYQGRVHGEAKAHFTLGFPGDDADGTLRVDTQLAVDELTAYGLRFDGGSADATWLWRHIGRGTRGAELSVRDGLLTRGAGRVLLRGQMAQEGKLSFTAFGEQLSLAQLLPALPSAATPDAELGFAGRVRGSVWLPEANIDLDILDARLGEKLLGDGAIALRVAHQRESRLLDNSFVLTADGHPCPAGRLGLLRADWGVPDDTAGGEARGALLCSSGFGGRVKLDAVVGVATDIPVRGVLELRGVPLHWFSAGADQSKFDGEVTGKVELSAGHLLRTDSFQGRVDISSLRVGGPDPWLQNQGTLRVALRGDGLEIERAEVVGRGTRLKLFGGLSLSGGIRAGIDGRLDLSVLPSLSSAVRRASGQLDLDVKLSGEVAAPTMFGRAELQEGSLLLQRFEHPFEKVSASVAFSEREVLIEAARAEVAHGVVRASGSAAIAGQGLGHYELAFGAESIALDAIPGMEVALSAEATLRSRPNALPELSGLVRLQRATYKRPISLGLTERLSGLSQAKRSTRETYNPAEDHVALDIQLVNDGPTRVQNNLLNADLVIDDAERPFRLVGTDQRIGALGTLEILRGTMQFRNTQFLVDGGTVTFVDETRIRTRLDLAAHTELRRQADASGARWQISLRARGDTDNLKIETSSTPALAQEDIALLLTVGLTRAEAERLGTSNLTQAAALEALASVTGVDREVKRALPVIDDFAVTSAYSARTNRTEPQVVVGKRLSERVRATATTGLTADSNFKTGVQWRLNDQTAVEAGYDNVQTTTSSQFGNVGLDLRRRLEFD